jgi:hypothetical protein
VIGASKTSSGFAPPSASLAPPPRKGSHYKVKHVSHVEILTVPAHRPIKPVYILDLVRFIERVIEAGE